MHPQQFEHLNHGHGTKSQPHNRTDQSPGQLRYLEQRLQGRHQQYCSQQYHANPKSSQQEAVVKHPPRQQYGRVGFAVKSMEQPAQAQSCKAMVLPVAAPPLRSPA